MDELRQIDELIAKIKGLGDSSDEVGRLIDSLEKMRESVGQLSDKELVKLQSRLARLLSSSEDLIENGNVNSDVLSDVLEKSDGIANSSKNTLEYLGKQTWQYKAISQTLEGIEKAAKAIWGNWKEIDDVASKHGRTIGLDANGISAYRQEMFRMYKDLAVQYGMNNKELIEYIERAKIRGTGNLKTYEVEYYKRYASAFAAFIMTVIGVSLSSRKRKGGMGFSLGVGLILSVAYAFFQAVTAGFATNANVPPIIAVWLPNIVFALIAYFLYRKAPK